MTGLPRHGQYPWLGLSCVAVNELCPCEAMGVFSGSQLPPAALLPHRQGGSGQRRGAASLRMGCLAQVKQITACWGDSHCNKARPASPFGVIVSVGYEN
jgi:hypothetical protein